MNASRQQAAQALQAAAGTLLSVLAPRSSKIARIAVRFREDAETASTDGNVLIHMPHTFGNRPIPEDATVTLGLVAHELGHWVQPLAASNEAARAERIPQWLLNIVLDIHGESFVAALFPTLARPLAGSRQAVKAAQMAAYQRNLEAALNRRAGFPDIALTACLISRFSRPGSPWDSDWLQAWRHRLPPRTEDFLIFLHTARAILTPPDQLPAYLEALIQSYPELRAPEAAGEKQNGAGASASGSSSEDAATPAALPAYPTSAVDGLGRILCREMQGNAAGVIPARGDALQTVSLPRSAPDPQARRLARALQPRFQSPAGSLEIAAPARLHRLDMARGAPLPFRMSLPGKDIPAPQIVLAVDVSSSMFSSAWRKVRQARIAAQAVALAVTAAGGQVVVILFNSHGFVSPEGDDALAFLSPDAMSQRFRGGTSFFFLQRAWRRWPGHQFLVLSDGDGRMPNALARDRARTSMLLIDSVMDVSPIAGRAISLNSLEHLASVFALLVPNSYR